MKGSIFVFSILAFLCFVTLVQCSRSDIPLKEHLKSRRQKRSVSYETDDSYLYSPVFVGNQDGLKEANKITELPGQPAGISFDHYSGHVTVDPTAGRALFYYFAESESSPSTKPLVLWLNGGPGCSSLGNGAMTELGPFRVNSDGKTLWHNPYAWNKAANVLFLESPAGVGFSYSNTTSDYTTGDKKTALDAYAFLVNWLERFPEYKYRDFFITGESYAGHYVPQLAQLILKNNKITNKTTINLKGIAIGNALIDGETRDKGEYDFFWMHAIISDEIHDGISKNCNFSSSATYSESCEKFLDQAADAVGDIDHYNIYAPICKSDDVPKYSTSANEFDPCSDGYADSYLNTLEVQISLHANITDTPTSWRGCTSLKWQDAPDTVKPLIKELSASGISVWIYSGDVDSVVSVTTTKYDLINMGLTVKTPWYPWMNQGEVGGYVVEYENVTFVTVRGAGHMVPSYQPARALAMFTSFLEGKLPPSK